MMAHRPADTHRTGAGKVANWNVFNPGSGDRRNARLAEDPRSLTFERDRTSTCDSLQRTVEAIDRPDDDEPAASVATK